MDERQHHRARPTYEGAIGAAGRPLASQRRRRRIGAAALSEPGAGSDGERAVPRSSRRRRIT